jgi:hypothetical protein
MVIRLILPNPWEDLNSPCSYSNFSDTSVLHVVWANQCRRSSKRLMSSNKIQCKNLDIPVHARSVFQLNTVQEPRQSSPCAECLPTKYSARTSTFQSMRGMSSIQIQWKNLDIPVHARNVFHPNTVEEPQHSSPCAECLPTKYSGRTSTFQSMCLGS